VDCGPDTVSIERVSADAENATVPAIVNAMRYLTAAEKDLIMGILFYSYYLIIAILLLSKGATADAV